MRPVERDVLHPLDGAHVAIVRLVLLGPKSEPCYRAVTPEADRGRRQLLGYRAAGDRGLVSSRRSRAAWMCP